MNHITSDRTKLIIDDLVISSRLCPDCGAELQLFQKERQGDFIFIWYKCTSKSCEGQWLQRYNTAE